MSHALWTRESQHRQAGWIFCIFIALLLLSAVTNSKVGSLPPSASPADAGTTYSSPLWTDEKDGFSYVNSGPTPRSKDRVVVVMPDTNSTQTNDQTSATTSSNLDLIPVGIVVLGGGLTPQGAIPPHTQLRLDHAKKIYDTLQGRPRILITTSGGTPHKSPPLDSNGFPIGEASAAAKQLVKMGLPMTDIWEENFSLDTIGNAFFLRTLHAEPAGLHHLMIITSSWHMERVQRIFDYVFSLPSYSLPATLSTSTSSLRGPSSSFNSQPKFVLEYHATDSGLPNDDVAKQRKDREAASLRHFNEVVESKYKSLPALHRFLFVNHTAYAVGHPQPDQSLSPALLQSY